MGITHTALTSSVIHYQSLHSNVVILCQLESVRLSVVYESYAHELACRSGTSSRVMHVIRQYGYICRGCMSDVLKVANSVLHCGIVCTAALHCVRCSWLYRAAVYLPAASWILQSSEFRSSSSHCRFTVRVLVLQARWSTSGCGTLSLMTNTL